MSAQITIIPDGTQTPLSSALDGEFFVALDGTASAVDGAPLLTIDDADVRLVNRGELETTGSTATVQIEGANAQITNVGLGSIDAEGTAVEVTSTGSAQIVNRAEISGDVNGVNFTNGGLSSGSLVNSGTISSDSRAVNIGGDGIDLVNSGDILGTGDQRNGTIYSDASAENFSITNTSRGVIDAGAGNQGAAISLQTGDVAGDDVSVRISNAGEIAGRGQASATTGTAGDGIRITAGAEGANFQGQIVNNGVITSDSAQGTTAAIRVANGVDYEGTIVNGARGVIDGVQNGLYFGTGDHDVNVRNAGVIESDSRAVNIDGSGVDLVNTGDILATGDQRNGTIYSDGTADNYTIRNLSTGRIDGVGDSNAAAVSLQTGDVDGDTVTASVFNSGTITGTGDAVSGNTVGDGVRVFSNFEDATFTGNIVNTGTISGSADSAEAAAISIESGVTLDGRIVNRGTLSAEETAIDASEAGGPVTVINTGQIDGAVVLSENDDSFLGGQSLSNVEIDGGAGNDRLIAGRGDDNLTGGLGDDDLRGGLGSDTASYADSDVPVTVDLDAGTASRETGFTVEVVDQPLSSLTTPQSSADLVQEAVDGNLYYNIHTNDVGSGEIRGQLLVASDETAGGVRTITLEADLDSAQEPNGTSDSAATGEGTLTITVDGADVTYSSTLTVSGLATSDLLPVAGVSSIHIHNAPAGSNGPVITDFIQDAGGDVNGNALSPAADTGDGNVFVEASETDTLRSIENIEGSDDGDVILGSSVRNELVGNDGDDVINGRGGADIIDGGAGDDILTGGGGRDTFVFTAEEGTSNDVVTDFRSGIDSLDLSGLGVDGLGGLGIEQVGDDLVITIDPETSITLEDFSAGSVIASSSGPISEDDFIFA